MHEAMRLLLAELTVMHSKLPRHETIAKRICQHSIQSISKALERHGHSPNIDVEELIDVAEEISKEMLFTASKQRLTL